MYWGSPANNLPMSIKAKRLYEVASFWKVYFFRNFPACEDAAAILVPKPDLTRCCFWRSTEKIGVFCMLSSLLLNGNFEKFQKWKIFPASCLQQVTRLKSIWYIQSNQIKCTVSVFEEFPLIKPLKYQFRFWTSKPANLASLNVLKCGGSHLGEKKF